MVENLWISQNKGKNHSANYSCFVSTPSLSVVLFGLFGASEDAVLVRRKGPFWVLSGTVCLKIRITLDSVASVKAKNAVAQNQPAKSRSPVNCQSRFSFQLPVDSRISIRICRCLFEFLFFFGFTKYVKNVKYLRYSWWKLLYISVNVNFGT